MKKFPVFAAALVLAVFPLQAQEKGDRRAPDFEVVSGDHQVMTLAGLKPYAVTVCFYECREVTELNRPFKDRLLALYGEMDETTRRKIFILSVGDCAKAKWPFVGLWEAALVDKSKKNGWTIFGDWTGRMRQDFRFAEGDSNFAVIGPDGTILYQISGKIGPAEAKAIEDLILSLLA